MVMHSTTHVKNIKKRAQHGELEAGVLALGLLESHMSASSGPGGPAYHRVPCLWPEKAVKDGPGPLGLHSCAKLEGVVSSWLHISTCPATAIT